MEKAVSGRASVSLPTSGKSKSNALAEANISKSTAHRYEKAASIPEEVIENYIATSTAANKPVKPLIIWLHRLIC